ncbi:small basic family protein [Clostridium sp.]|uniref:small basic family protein n=1 Tax=Clostridium sp. TaxID=1506 RepID=UPI002FC86B63
MVAFVGLILGIVLGLVWNINIPLKFSPYISVAIFACIDSMLGAIRGSLNKDFRPDIFISGFFGNAVLAALMVYLGDKLGIPIYLAAIIVFGGRVFTNFAIIRRLLMERTKFRH